MHNAPAMPFLPWSPYGALPVGWSSRGLPKPSGVLPPPPAFVEAQELAFVRRLNAYQTPQANQFTTYLSEEGGTGLWWDMAKQYRRSAGFVRGWLGTGMMAVAMGATAVRTQGAKQHYGRLRPYQVDGTIQPVGKVPKDRSYPSGHTSSAYAAATVLGHLWPARAYEFNWWARQVGLSRMHAGMHFPSDVKVGALLGQKVGTQVASLLWA